MKQTVEGSARKPPATFEVAGAGNEMMAAGPRANAKAMDHQPEPTVGAPDPDPTDSTSDVGGRLLLNGDEGVATDGTIEHDIANFGGSFPMSVSVIQTKRLRVEIRDSGPRLAFPLLLLHGWPDDASAWDKIAPLLNSANFRTIVPMCRGFGKTCFLSAKTSRTGNVGILALDAIELMDALSIRQFFVAGHDWGSNIAEALAVGWPNRVGRIAMISTPSRLGGLKTPSFEQASRQWYHWFQATKRGAEAVRKDPKGFAQIMWKTWSPKGWFKHGRFDRVAKSFRNPDWVAVTLHSYRSRWGEAAFDPRSLKLEAKIKATRRLAQPMIFLQGEKDGVTPPKASQEMARKFKHFHRIVLKGVGHFPPREAPAAVAKQLIRHFSALPAD